MSYSQDFVVNLIKHIGSPEAYVLKRAFGKDPSNASIETTIAYLSIEPDSPIPDTIGILVSSMFYTYVKDKDSMGNIYFSTLLKSLYSDSSDSYKRRISRFVTRDFDDNGVFEREFANICKMPAMSASLGKINYFSLLDDLYSWNDDRTVRLRWARNIFRD